MLQNVKLAARMLLRTPFVTAVAVLSLALGIGANSAIFSLFDQILLRPLPVPAPTELVNLSAPGPKPGSQSCSQAGDCDVVLYQAGADPHVDDPLGGWLTTEQLRRRDARVFQTFARLGVPVAWNLAGGYQREPDGSIPKVLEIHDNTAIECLRALHSERRTG